MLPRKFIVPSTLTLLLATVLAAGCSEKQANAPAEPDDEEEGIVGGQSFALIEGRTVEVDIWYPASEGKPGRYVPTVMELNPKREANQFVSDLILACVTSEFRNATSTEAWNEAHTSCRLPPRPWQLDGTMLGFGLPLPLL